VADRLGINLTDFKCLSILEKEPSVTAGRLAELTGLTTGAVTGVVDRLEKAGFARRVKDPDDRRHVIIEAAREREKEVDGLFGALGRAMGELHRRYKEAELEVIADFLARTTSVLREQTAKLRVEAEPAGGAGAGSGGAAAPPLGSVEAGRLRFSWAHDVRVTLDADRRLPDLYAARFEGRVPAVKVEGGIVTVQYPRFTPFDWRKLSAHLTLNAAVPWHVEFRGGVNKLSADLGPLVLAGLEMTGGVSDVTVALPKPAGHVLIRISGGASNVVLRRPASAAAQLEISGGASKLAFDDQRLGAIGGRTRLATPEFRAATDRYAIEVTGGASNLTIETR
jgi:DNA-binding MarR family transcriptional regulator